MVRRGALSLAMSAVVILSQSAHAAMPSTVRLSGAPGHATTLTLAKATRLDLEGALLHNIFKNTLTGPALGDWAGVLLEDAQGAIVAGGFCSRLVDALTICLPVGDNPDVLGRGTYTVHIVGNGARAVSLVLEAPGLPTSLVVAAKRPAARGSLFFVDDELQPAWNDSLSLTAPSAVIVGTAQVSKGKPLVGVKTAAQCVSPTALPCPPSPEGVTDYASVSGGTFFVAESQEYPAGSLSNGSHAWIGATAGSESSHVRFAAILPA